jgi:hypothetical protein
MLDVQRRIIDLLRIRAAQVDYFEIPAFLRMTAEQRRQAWIIYDNKRATTEKKIVQLERKLARHQVVCQPILTFDGKTEFSEEGGYS